MIYTYKGKTPKIDDTSFIAPGVQLIGDVTVGAQASVWFNSVVRGDNEPITIGDRTNVQDGSVLHVNPAMPLTLENDVSIGHNVILHACTVRQGALIGMGAIILDKAEIGEFALVGAGSLVPVGKKVPPRTLVIGNPFQVVRELTDDEIENMLKRTVRSYIQKGEEYREIINKK
jgi:carbonic anhydrase/acetyltransferase-like protein (isoleucine patch superfamily)